MSRKYKFLNQEGLYFVSFATVNWIDVFVREEYCAIITDSLNYCSEHLGLQIYCWCIKPSNIHLIFSTKDANPSQVLGRFKEYTAKKLAKAIETNSVESRKEWMLWMMTRAASKNSSVSKLQFWQHHNQPIELWSIAVIEQKVNYIHENPVKAGFVVQADHWKYSSAVDYSGKKGLVKMQLLW
jgi:putative transposase